MSFSKRLKISRKEKGISQEQLAEKLNVSRQSVAKWEAGLAYPELRTHLLLSSALERSLDWLFYDEQAETCSRFRKNAGTSEWHSLAEQFPSFTDRKALQASMEEDLLHELLKAMSGYEIDQIVEEEIFRGRRTCIFYKGRVFSETEGMNPQTGEEISDFSEMTLSEARELLPLPWEKPGRIRKTAAGFSDGS